MEENDTLPSTVSKNARGRNSEFLELLLRIGFELEKEPTGRIGKRGA